MTAAKFFSSALAPTLAAPLLCSCGDHALFSRDGSEGVASVSQAVLTSPNSSPPLAIGTFVVYAAQRVTLGAGDHTVGGDVGVSTTTGPNPALTVGGLAGMDLARTLVAPSIAVGNGAITGPVKTTSLTNNGGHVGAQTPYPATMPSLPAVIDSTPSAVNVTVAVGQRTTLSPGNFGTLTDNGTVFLDPGNYSFSNVAVGDHAQLVAQPGGATSVRVAGTFATGTFTQIFPVGQLANTLTISVGGADGVNASPPAVSVGSGSAITSLLVAPNGTVSLGKSVLATGAFAGSSVVADTNVLLTFQSGFPTQTPDITAFVAYATRSVTFGSGDRTLGGDVGVARAATVFANLNYYQRPDGTQFFAVDREPSLSLTVKILRVGGTDTFVLPTQAGIPGPLGGLAGNDFRDAYLSGCEAGLDGSGQSIALFELQGFNVSDILAYDKAAGIPDPNLFADTFTPNFPASIFDSSNIPVNGSVEAPIDIEVAHAMAPGASVVVYQAPFSSDFGVNYAQDMLHGIAHPDSALPFSRLVSSSWTYGCDDDCQQSIDDMGAQGQTYFQATGDGGAYTRTPGDNRTYNNITLVGATSLGSAAIGAQPTETTMNQGGFVSGGGFFGSYTLNFGPSGSGSPVTFPGIGIPSYQTAFVNATNQASSQFRNIPDISMVGTNIFNVTTAGNGTAGQVSNGGIGTSFATPLLAGFMAMVNQKSAINGVGPVGFANPVLYAIAKPGGPLATTCFNDPGNEPGVAGGNNPPTVNNFGFASSAGATVPVPAAGFPAVPGYDLGTGLGSPTCALITQMASPTPTVPVPPPPPPPPPPSLDGGSTGPFTTAPLPTFAAIGKENGCGIDQGAIECWGLNAEGEVGDGSNSQRLGPVCNPLSKSSVTNVAAGNEHSCALLPSGTVSCWGDNRSGQIGSLGGSGSNTPVNVTGFPTGGAVNQISAGGDTTCALMQDATVWCWGDNARGQLGIGSTNTTANPNPSQVQGLPAAAQVSVSTSGLYVCALLETGNVDCWGDGDFSTLGNNTHTSSNSPQQVLVLNVPLGNAVMVSAGDTHACALTSHQMDAQPGTGAAVYCWGDNSARQLGEGDVSNGGLPKHQETAVLAVAITGCTGNIPGGGGCPPSLPVASVACGAKFTCVLLTDGTVSCLGQARLDLAPDQSMAAMQTVAGLSGVTGISAGNTGACARLSSEALSCWGDSPVGDGTNNAVGTPTRLTFARCL